MKITIKEMHLENFKGIKELNVKFGDKTCIKGCNGSGKTTVVDAFTWLFFNKDSHFATDFAVRPLNDDGSLVNFVDIKVSALVDIDGKETEFAKVQKQNWVKQRGSETSVFKGNVNEYLIDGYPKSEKEYKEVINGIISEDMFKILTNPTFFPNLKWKEQRDILMRFATTESDYDLATRLGGYEMILDELQKAPSTEDILAKYKKSKKELETTLKEIPVRIDELHKQVVDVDVAELELMKKAIAERNEDKNRRLKAISDAKSEIMNLEFKINDYVRNANSEIIKKRSDSENELMLANTERNKISSDISALDIKKLQVETSQKSLTDESVALGLNYKSLGEKKFDDSIWVFDESAKSCHVCGQMLPKSKIDTLVADFEKRKADAIAKFESDQKAKLSEILARGKELKALIENAGKEIELIENQISDKKRLLIPINEKIDALNKTIAGIPERVDLSTDTTYLSLVNEKENLAKQVTDLSVELNAVSMTTDETSIAEIDRKIASVTNNENIEKRIGQLQEEQRDTSQRIATCEHFIYVTEQFIKAKLENISESINSKFKLVNFKLWDTQINGSVVECCTPTYNGVNYSDLNNGHKIVGGIDICNSLASLLGVGAPIFVDNAESINTYNIPASDSQMICLYVSEDKNLIVE